MKKTVMILSKTMLALALFLNCGMSGAHINSTKVEKNYSRPQVPSLAPMLKQVLPSVISITIEGHTVAHSPRIPHQLEPFFSENSPFCQKNSPFRHTPFCHLDSNNESSEEAFRALGSGVIINAEKGYAVTNSHVIEDAEKISVKLSDGRRYTAKVVGIDKDIDIALIQLKHAKNLQGIKIANSDSLRVGDYVLAIGNPYGLGETVTSGIISALGRSGLHLERYENFIQTDAAINQGNSGGALINLKGELIGINTAILAPYGGNIGIGFAIPGNMVNSLAQQITHFGKVKRGSLGIVGIELNTNLAKVMKINIQKGAFIKKVVPNSSAFNSGIRAGDIIVGLNKKPIVSFAALQAEIGSLPVSTKIELNIFRNQKIIPFVVELKDKIKETVKTKNIYTGIEGIQIRNHSFQKHTFITVDNVKKHTKAFKIGFKKNDIILTINQKKISNINQLKKILDTKPSILVFSIKRGNNILYLVSK